ncbi:MAG: NADH-quinone oxidoreductase subunit NuoK [Candidatus Hodarchaeales archaeon]|jgi:NADH-quinone oxidoreductase subunit K
MSFVANIPIIYVLLLSATLLVIGAYGLMTKKNGVRLLMCIEIILNAANINFIAFSAYGPLSGVTAPYPLVGQVFTLFSIIIAAAEASVGLAILLVLYKHYKTISIDKINQLRG